MLTVGKVLMVVAAMGAIAVGAKIVRQLNRPDGDPVGKDKSPGSVEAGDLVQCPRCGAYAARKCGKTDCPMA